MAFSTNNWIAWKVYQTVRFEDWNWNEVEPAENAEIYENYALRSLSFPKKNIKLASLMEPSEAENHAWVFGCAVTIAERGN